MLNVNSMRQQVIYPFLNEIGKWSKAAGELVFGTAILESNLTDLKQAWRWSRFRAMAD
jgi:hypothetical protein